jgi:Holliday junction DNA helicase RuvB
MGRPLPSWHGFVGQSDIVGAIKSHCRGSLSKGEALLHILLKGTSGTGKTHLARAVAIEMQTNCLTFYSSKQSRKWQLAESLLRVKKGDIFFIDEVHALPPDCQELLYPAIDEKKVPEVDREKHHVIENKWVSIPEFTLIVATDQPGILNGPLRERFPLKYTLSNYTAQEMRQIVSNRATELNLYLKPQAAARMAEAAHGNPRRAKHLLQSLRTLMPDLQEDVTKEMVERNLKIQGIDVDNLRSEDRSYLSVLRKCDGHMSLPTLALQLELDEMALRHDVETYLIKMGWVGIDCRGRFLTSSGKMFVEGRGL